MAFRVNHVTKHVTNSHPGAACARQQNLPERTCQRAAAVAHAMPRHSQTRKYSFGRISVRGFDSKQSEDPSCHRQEHRWQTGMVVERTTQLPPQSSLMRFLNKQSCCGIHSVHHANEITAPAKWSSRMFFSVPDSYKCNASPPRHEPRPSAKWAAGAPFQPAGWPATTAPMTPPAHCTQCIHAQHPAARPCQVLHETHKGLALAPVL